MPTQGFTVQASRQSFCVSSTTTAFRIVRRPICCKAFVLIFSPQLALCPSCARSAASYAKLFLGQNFFIPHRLSVYQILDRGCLKSLQPQRLNLTKTSYRYHYAFKVNRLWGVIFCRNGHINKKSRVIAYIGTKTSGLPAFSLPQQRAILVHCLEKVILIKNVKFINDTGGI